MEFHVGQLVRVARQPENQFVHIKGEVAFIDEMRTYPDGTWASIRALSPNGEATGGGSVPVSCLEPCTDSAWLAAYETYKRNFEARMAEARAYSDRYRAAYQKALEITAEEHGLTPELVEKVVRSFNARKPD